MPRSTPRGFEEEVQHLLAAMPESPVRISCPDGTAGILMTEAAYEKLYAEALHHRNAQPGSEAPEDDTAAFLTGLMREHDPGS